jgi:hypothetical protein
VRPRGRHAATVVLAGLVGAGTLAAGTYGAAAAPVPAPAEAPVVALRSAAAPAADPVALGVTSIKPLVLTSAGRLTISGTMVNHESVALTDLSIQLRVGTTPEGSRGELAASAASTARPAGNVITSALVHPTGSLPAGGSLAWTVTAKASALGLTIPGVYPIAVEVIAADPVAGGRLRVGTARTFLPWDLGQVKPTRLAVVFPVIGTPSRGPDGRDLKTATQDQLTGRLQTLLQASGGAHLTWVLDGDTLESVAQLATSTTPTPTAGPTSGGPTSGGSTTGGPSPTGSGTGTSPGSGVAETARTWLDDLARDVTTGQVVALPFGDPDVVATVRAGRAADLDVAGSLGTQVVGQELGGAVPVSGDVAWPADGSADGRTLQVVSEQGTGAVILSDTYAAPLHPVTTYTQSGVGPLSGTTMTGVVTDSVLSNLLATAPAQLGGPALARQRILAELAMVTSELPFDQRSIVVAPPRRWTPDPTYMRSLLDALSQVPWVQPATLDELRVGAASGPVRKRPVYPVGLVKHEVSQDQFVGIDRGSAGLDALTAILTNPTTLRNTVERALLRSGSTWWRTQRVDGAEYIDAVDATVAKQVSAVRVVKSGALTLAARSGKIPVTVENGLNQTVTMHVSVAADPAVRLTLTQPAALKIPAGESRTFEVPAEATTNGDVMLIVRLLTPDGKPYGSAVTFPVQITGFGEVAQLVVGGAFVLLAIALVVRIVRAVRGGRRPGSVASVRERAK